MIRRRAVLAGLACGLAQGEAEAMDEAAQIFAAVDALVVARDESFEALGSLTHVALQEAPGNAFTLIRTGAFGAGSPFATIEIRKPRNGQAPGGLIILNIRPEICVAPGNLTAHYGQIDDLAPPLAGGPPGRPVYWSYKRPWGDLSFGVAPGKTGECITQAIIDWN